MGAAGGISRPPAVKIEIPIIPDNPFIFNDLQQAQGMTAESAEHRQRIWQVVAAIPPGRVASYGQVAGLAGLPGRARLVGRTMAGLPPGSTLPWHRVVNARGRLSFPEGSPAHRRQKSRLEAEGIVFTEGRLSLSQYTWHPENGP